MSGLFYSTKILLKKLNKGSVCTKPKNGSQSYEHVQVSKAYTRRTNDKVVCLSVFFFFNVLPRHTNLFEECAVLCAHLSPRKEDCTSSY